MINTLRIIVCSLGFSLLLSACGGGGGGGGATNHAPVLTAVADVSMLSGINLTIPLTAADQDNDTVLFSVSGGSAATVSATVSGNLLTLTTSPGYVTTLPITFTVTATDGKGGADSTTVNVSVAAPTKAILTVSTANVPVGTLVGGAQISITLPAGVTPSVLSGNDASGSVAASGNALNGSLAASSYDVLTRTLTPGTVSGTGFASGEFLTITCSIAAGTSVTASDFPAQATVISIFDVNSTNIPGATSPVSVTFQ